MADPDCCTCGSLCPAATCTGAVASEVTFRIVPEGVGLDATGECVATAVVKSFVLGGAGGAGYSSAPAVVFSGGSPTRSAAAHTTINVGGHVATLVLDDPGEGYIQAPTATLVGGGGTGATVTNIVMETKCCIPIARPANYLISATITGGVTRQGIASLVTCATGGLPNNPVIAFPAAALTYVFSSTCEPNTPSTPSVTTKFTQGATVTTRNGSSALLNPAPGVPITVEVTSPCYETVTDSVPAMVCGQSILKPTTLTAKLFTVNFKAVGCIGFPLAGASVHLSSGAGGYDSTQSTGSDGIASFSGVPAHCPMAWTMTKDRFVGSAASFTSGCTSDAPGVAGITSSLNGPAPGYWCCGSFNEPLPTTLFLTNAHGTFMVTLLDDGGHVCYEGPEEEMACSDGFDIVRCNTFGAFPPRTYTGSAAVGLGFACGADPAFIQLNQSWSACGTSDFGIPEEIGIFTAIGGCGGGASGSPLNRPCNVFDEVGPPRAADSGSFTDGVLVHNPPYFPIPANVTGTLTGADSYPGGSITLSE